MNKSSLIAYEKEIGSNAIQGENKNLDSHARKLTSSTSNEQPMKLTKQTKTKNPKSPKPQPNQPKKLKDERNPSKNWTEIKSESNLQRNT